MGLRFHDLKYFEVGIIFPYPLIRYNFEGNTTKNCRKYQFNAIVSFFRQILKSNVFNISTCTLFAMSSKLCRYSFSNFFCQHKLLGFVGQCVSEMLMSFPFTKFKVSI